MSWVVSSRNHNQTCWASAAGGLPATKPKWQLLKCAKYGVDWEVCATDDMLYLCSARRIALSFDINTGEKRWETQFPDVAMDEIAINDTHVCVPPYMVAIESGAIERDLSEFGYKYRMVEDVDDGAFIITTDGEQKGVLICRDADCSFYSISLAGVSSAVEKGLLIGYDEKDSLVCYSTQKNSILWAIQKYSGDEGVSKTFSSGYMIIGDIVFQHLNHDTLRAIGLETGHIIWQSGSDYMVPQEIGETKRIQAPSRFLGCDDTLYIGVDIDDNGYLQARSTDDGRELWRVETPQARMFLIAGDLLFGALSDFPVAWDRHTGEVVWRAEKAMPPIFHAVAAGNKVIYTNTTSQMRCYEWNEPYRSPAAV